MKKKIETIDIAIVILFVIICIFLISAYFYLPIYNGYKIYGNDYCNTKHYLEPSLPAFSHSEWTCKLCGKTEPFTDANPLAMCYKCSSLTERCRRCGKLLKGN